MIRKLVRIKMKAKAWKHFCTITRHRHQVIRNCYHAGILWQGLRHDLSKYSPTEFIPGAKYYQGNRSPNAEEREVNGYSVAWMHHQGRNKHHFEYWQVCSKRWRRICFVRFIILELPISTCFSVTYTS